MRQKAKNGIMLEKFHQSFDNTYLKFRFIVEIVTQTDLLSVNKNFIILKFSHFIIYIYNILYC